VNFHILSSDMLCYVHIKIMYYQQYMNCDLNHQSYENYPGLGT